MNQFETIENKTFITENKQKMTEITELEKPNLEAEELNAKSVLTQKQWFNGFGQFTNRKHTMHIITAHHRKRNDLLGNMNDRQLR